jgi:hypothetical protein
MPISALNFFWLTDPHDLQDIPPPSGGKLRSQYIITQGDAYFPRRQPVLPRQKLREVVFPICRESPLP